MATLPPLQGEGWGGDGVIVTQKPIPILAFPLKGKEQFPCFFERFGLNRVP
jgi:hypothetical protein